MLTRIDRRALLGGAMGIAAGLMLPGAARAASRADAVRAQDLGQGLFVIGGVGANVLAATSADGILLVDAGDVASRSSLRSQLARLPGRGRVLTLVNTHWHREQTGGNEVFGKAGATIVAHRKTWQRLSTKTWQPQPRTWLEPLPKAAWPAKTFYTTEAVAAAGHEARLGYLLEAHTDGDIYVHFPGANVLAVGDALAAPDADPVLDWFGGGWVGGRLDALDALLALADERTRIVPAQGPVVGRRELQAERDLFAGLYDKLSEMVRKGFTDEDMLAAKVLESTGRDWRDPAGFLYSAQKGLWAHHNTLSHQIV